VEKADLEEKQDWTENKAKVSKMRFMKLFVSLAALCLLAGFARAAQNGNGPCAGTGNCNENCIKNCENQDACNQQNCQVGAPCQDQNCQNGNAQGPQDETGPLRDGSCQE